MMKIVLGKQEWNVDYDSPVGKSGGFGDVFIGSGDVGGTVCEVAVKRLKLDVDSAAHREMDIASYIQSKSYQNIVPVYDVGLDDATQRYFVVMPLCDSSLQDAIDRGYNSIDTLAVVQSVLNGLVELSEVVHRDLKPDNILLHEGVWKITDFGIARFTQKATSLRTLKKALTPAYAAPEQYRYERASNSTDIYALGCIIYALEEGRPPFLDCLDIEEAHLNKAPDKLNSELPKTIIALVNTMLSKDQSSRPSAKRCMDVIQDCINQSASDPIAEMLSSADLHVSEEEAEKAAEEARKKASAERKSRIRKSAEDSLEQLKQNLSDTILSKAATAKNLKGDIYIGNARIKFSSRINDYDSWLASDFKNPRSINQKDWEFCCAIDMSVVGCTGFEWATTLFYASFKGESYRWYEANFFAPFSLDMNGPVSLSINDTNFHLAFTNVMGVYQFCFGPRAIDVEDEADFQKRWAALLARAAKGELYAPRTLPVRFNEDYSY
ncbi:MAG: serine/threonine protein kinase [Alphaproteobacteria bacterium]|nr:serine/threonine protein kinase [Alphaproteobacteria bacterium]